MADWESGNKSRRMILSYDQRIMTGQYPVADLMGYRHTKDGQLVIEPEEAKTVRFIFLAFMLPFEDDNGGKLSYTLNGTLYPDEQVVIYDIGDVKPETEKKRRGRRKKSEIEAEQKEN